LVQNHAMRDLTFAHDHDIGTELAQIIDLLIGMRPGDDADRRIGGPRQFDHPPRLEAIGDREDGEPGAGDIGGGERLRSGRM
jgi:hypothetical protein